MDGGYKLTSDLAATLGYRYGHQYQQGFPPNINSMEVNGQPAQSSSDYQRVLFGLEGRPWKWLTLNIKGGPDFRDYNTAAPVPDSHVVDSYEEASLTATLASNQSVSFLCKHWRWVSSIGRLPFAETTYGMAYHWNPLQPLGFDCSVKYAKQDYTIASATLSQNYCMRNDVLWTFSGGVRYAFSAHSSAGLEYTYEMARNELDHVATANYRQFDHQLASLGVKFSF